MRWLPRWRLWRSEVSAIRPFESSASSSGNSPAAAIALALTTASAAKRAATVALLQAPVGEVHTVCGRRAMHAVSLNHWIHFVVRRPGGKMTLPLGSLFC
jgi:hypothetical protein